MLCVLLGPIDILHAWLMVNIEWICAPPMTYFCLCVDPGGTDGLFAQKTMEITDEALSSYKNQGGYDMLGRTRDQIRTTEQVKAAMATCQALKLDALVIIGGIVCFVCLLSFIYDLDQIQAHNVFL